MRVGMAWIWYASTRATFVLWCCILRSLMKALLRKSAVRIVFYLFGLFVQIRYILKGIVLYFMYTMGSSTHTHTQMIRTAICVVLLGRSGNGNGVIGTWVLGKWWAWTIFILFWGSSQIMYRVNETLLRPHKKKKSNRLTVRDFFTYVWYTYPFFRCDAGKCFSRVHISLEYQSQSL